MSDDDEFAFPRPDERNPDGAGIIQGSHGMTLRDWFAGQVAPTIDPREFRGWQLDAWFGKGAFGVTDAQMIAAASYDIADAMIARRKINRSK